MPVPRGPASEVRLALSKEPLKMIRRSFRFCPSFTRASATGRQTRLLSSEHGPAIRRSFLG